ncbi:MAG TPA: phage tail tape measure protein [Candidatus Companilactobacillus pullicola]|uniref:Phage tail tape measure protein n=1 Tax=Candidatus Companilactobacillus pullicola TaxID=2838523 RepID=A0A9D1ZLX1_9LACO|nr:phage tail tape measure protein [Candidatus Companilactobacillus pullicola]
MAKDMELNTGIHIDSIQAEGSLQSLRNQVKALTSEWKINEQVQRANGDYQSAYQAKAEGLGRAIEGQTNYLNRLKSEMSNLDRTTTEGSQKFSQYTNQVNTATRQLNNMVMQQERAKSTLDLYTTGIKEQKQAMENAKNVSQSLVERYKAEGKEIKASATERTALKTRIQELNSLYSKESSELERVKNESGATSKEYATQAKRVNELGTEIAKSRTRYRELGSELGGMGTHFTGIRQAAATSKTAIGNMNNSIKNSISHMKNMAMTAGIAGAAVTAMFVSGAKKSVELENSYKQITNLAETGGEKVVEATKNVSRMQEDGQKYALKYGKSQQEIADGYEDLIKRGYDTKQALGAMKSELQASVASGDDFKDVVKVSSQTLEAFGMRTNSTSGMIKNTKKTVNDLAYAADMTATGFSDLGVGMSYVGSTAHQAGFSLSETSSAMGILSNNGLEAEKSGTGLRKVINSLISPTKTGASALQELGLSTKDFTDNKGNMKSMTDIFGLLHDKMQDMGKNKQTDIFHDLFGTTGQQAGLILAENAKQLGELNQKVADSAKNDYVGKLAKKNSETGKVALDRLKQSVNAITMTISSAALPAITEIGDKLAKAAGTKEFENAVKGVGKWVGNLTDKVADFFTYLGKHSDDLKGITGSLGTIVKDIAVGAWDTFYGIIKGIGKAFNLVHTNGKKAEDPLKVLNQFVSGIAKHEQALKTIGGLLAGIWVADKVANFAVKINDVADAFGGLSKKLKNSGIQQAASEVGAKTGENLTQGITSKLEDAATGNGLTTLGKSMMGKLSLGMGAVQVGFDIVGAIKAKNPEERTKNAGGAIGTSLGLGIGAVLGGPVGAMIGTELGDQIGKNAAPSIENLFKNGSFYSKKSLEYMKEQRENAKENLQATNKKADFGNLLENKFDPKKADADAAKNYAKEKAIFDKWNKKIEDYKKEKSKSSKNTSTAKAIQDVATTHVSKTDIKNVKDMVPAIKAYEKAIKGLKSNLRKNSPAKELSKIDKSISGSTKSWTKLAKPIETVGKSFKSLNSFTKSMKKDPFKAFNKDLVSLHKTLKKNDLTQQLNKMDKALKKNKLADTFKKMSDSIKKDTKAWTSFAKPVNNVAGAFKKLSSFTKSMKKDPFESFNKDLKNLEATLKKSKLSNYLNDLYKQLKKDRLYSQFDKLSHSIKDNTKTWTKFAKPIRDVQKAFQELNKFTRMYSKSDPFASLDKDIKNLTKTLNSNNIGKLLKSQITEANKATSNVTFDKDFKTDTDNIVDALKSFKANFDKSWKNVWANTGSEEKDGLAKVVSDYSSKMNAISKKETSFSSDYLKKWSSWLKSVKNSFKTAFDSLPGLASKSLSKVISEVNKGIGGINSVITDFGGKSLNMAKYAVGTAGTPGGNLAVVGEQGYELAYDKQNGIYPVGLQGEEVRYLGADTAILPHHLSEQFMGMVANLPHHATGKGDTNKTSEDMTDYIFKHLDELKKDPVPFLKKPYFEKASFSGNDFISRFGNAISNGFLKAIAEPFKKILADMDFSGAGGARPAKAYGPMIKAAAAYMHQKITDFNVDMIERIIANESVGDPNVTNNWDSNAKAGTPSTGILQYILPTFLNYAMPGHTNIHNPLDQLIALFNDATWRSDMGMGYNGKYGEWRGSASGPSGPRLMAAGGLITQATNAIVGEAGPEMVVPLNDKMRAVQIIEKAKSVVGGNDTNASVSVDTTRVESNQQQQLMMTQIMVKLLSKIADGSMASDVSNGGTSLNDISNALDKIGLSNRKMTKFQGKGGTAFA